MWGIEQFKITFIWCAGRDSIQCRRADVTEYVDRSKMVRTLTTRTNWGWFKPYDRGILTVMGCLSLGFDIRSKTLENSTVARIGDWKTYSYSLCRVFSLCQRYYYTYNEHCWEVVDKEIIWDCETTKVNHDCGWLGSRRGCHLLAVKRTSYAWYSTFGSLPTSSWGRISRGCS